MEKLNLFQINLRMLRLSLHFLWREFLESMPVVTVIKPCNRHPRYFDRVGVVFFSQIPDAFPSYPSPNLYVLSSRQKKIAEKSDMEEAFKAASTKEDMLKSLEKMEAVFKESELGMAYLKVGLKMEAEDVEKSIYFAHKALKSLHKDHKPSLPLAMALQLIGSSYYRWRKFSDSLWYLNKSDKVLIKLQKMNKSPDGGILPVIHAVHSDLANVKTAMGRREEAILNLKKCLEIKEFTIEKHSKELGLANRDLAEAYSSVFNFKDALPYCLKSIEIHKFLLGDSSVEVAHDRRLLGMIYSGLGQNGEAIEQNMLSQKILKNWGLGSDLIRAEIDSSNFLIALGRNDEAIDVLKSVLQRKEEEGDIRAVSLLSMGRAFCNLGRFDDSKLCLGMACGILEKKDSIPIHEVCEAYMEISMQYETMNEFENAISILKRAMAMLEKLPHEQHSEADTSARIGWLLLLTGKVDQAIPYLEGAAETLKECFGCKHFGVGYIYNNLGAAFLEIDRPESAARSFSMAKDILDVSLGPHHSDSIETCQNLAKAHNLMKNYNTAIDFQKKAVTSWESHGPVASDKLEEACRILRQLEEDSLVKHSE